MSFDPASSRSFLHTLNSSVPRWGLIVLSVGLTVGCGFFERADAGNETGGDGDSGESGGATGTGGMVSATGGTDSSGGMGGLFGGGCPVEPCATGGDGSGGSSSGGASSGGAFGTGGAASCGMVSNAHDIHLIVESYEISGASCDAVMSTDFDAGADGFSLNTDEGVSGTTASTFAYCDGGLEVTLTISADGRAEVRHSIGAGVAMNGCALNATVRLISDEACGVTAGLQMYSGTDGGDIGDSHASTPVTLQPDVPTDLTFQLPAFTTVGTDPSYGVTIYRGDLTCQ